MSDDDGLLHDQRQPFPTQTVKCPVCEAEFDEPPLRKYYRGYLARIEELEGDVEAQARAWRGQEDELRAVSAENKRLREALGEITEGKGRFSTDQFEHARNTIEDMKELARAALRGGTE
jgi:hypothetical protein